MTVTTVIGTDVIVTGSMYRTTSEGWESSRQIATFMLPHRTHGLVDLHHAARIAADILATYTPADTYISLGLSTVDCLAGYYAGRWHVVPDHDNGYRNVTVR
jgi:hypothetical protein